LQSGHAAQSEREVEDDFGNVLQTALGDVLAATEVTEHRGQARAERVSANLGRDGLTGDMAATGAGAGMALELGDHSADLG
jgi:hypothetical protein